MFKENILFLFLLMSCSDSKKSDEPSPEDESSTSSAPGSLAIGTQVSQNLSDVDQNLKVVQTDLAPPPVGTLAIGSQSQPPPSNLMLSTLDKANEIKTRVKGNVEGTTRALGWIRDVINRLKPQLEGKEEKSGVIDFGFSKVSFSFETESKYKIRDIGGEGGNYHIEVDGTTYILYRTPPKNVEPYKVGDNKIVVHYQDEKNWNLRDDNTWADCKANRPEVLISYVERIAGIWYGKMVFGNGNIVFKCPEEVGGKNYNYYQYVGSEEEMTAAGYEGVPLEFNDFSKIEQYAVKDMGTELVNPICIKENVDPVPNLACESSNADIKNAIFKLNDKWVAPVDVTKTVVKFPGE